jgi:hypothetical protein
VTVHPPPADPAELADFPVRAMADTYPYARIHDEAHEPHWFCSCGNHRFDPPSGSNAFFGACYLAGNPLGAFIERFGDFPVISRARVDACQLASLLVPATRLADVTSRAALRWGVTAELSAGGDYPGCQQWAERFFQAGFGGIWYTAKHDPRGDLHSIALFGKPGVHEEAFADSWSEPIGDDLVNDVKLRFGIQVVPPAAL